MFIKKLDSLFVPAHLLVIFAGTALFFTAAFWFSFDPFIPLFIGTGLIGLSLFFKSPLSLLTLLIIVRMSLDYSSQYFTFSLYERVFTLSQLIGLGIAILGALLLVKERKKILKYPLIWPFAALLFWGIATLFYSFSPTNTLTEILRIFAFSSIAFFAYAVTRTQRDYSFLLKAVLLSSVIPLFFSLYQFLTGTGLSDSDVLAPRIFGTFAHPNILSLYLFTLIMVSILYALTFSKKQFLNRRLFFLFLFGIFSFFLLLTFTRVAWLITFLFLLIIILFRYRIAIIPVILLPVILFFTSETFQERVNETLAPPPDSSIVWRKNLWHDTTLKTFQDGRASYGYGLGTFPLISLNLRGENIGSHDPHNDTVRFFIEGGFIGLTVYLLYLFSVFILLLFYAKKTSGWQRESFLILALFWACLFLAGQTDNLFKNSPVEWIFFILVSSLIALTQRQIKKDPPL